MEAIANLLEPRRIAVIGASADAGKTAGLPIRFLTKHGFTGEIYPVNPRLDSIDGLRCYPDIASLPADPDVAIVLLGAVRANVAVRELAARGTKAAVVVAGGYAETGEEGAARQRELIDAAGRMRLLGPNTIGLVNVAGGITLSVSSALEMDRFPKGVVGVVSQSGGILGSLLSRAAARGIGLSALISTGNEADLGLADFIDHLADDPGTKVIALYIESVRNTDTFAAAALKAARSGKTVVAYKVGRSAAGARAAVSHTGAMAGSDRMYDALFESIGIIRLKTFTGLLDVSAALATGRRLHGRRVAILTSSGGAGTLVTDSLGVAGFETPDPDAAAVAALKSLLPGDFASLDRNPIDVTLAGLKPNMLRGAVEALQASPSYDALVVIVGSSGVAQPGLMAGALERSTGPQTKPVLAYVSPHAPAAASLLTERGIPAFTAPESCADALSGLWHAATWKPPADRSADPTRQILVDLPGGTLDEHQAKSLFAGFGIPSARERIVSTAFEAEQAADALGGRVVLKILSAEITHKSDVGGVAVDLNRETIGARLSEMAWTVAQRTGRAPKNFLAQEMLGGIELILGLRRDPIGTAILLGMGGVAAELMDDIALLMLPSARGLFKHEAAALIRRLKSWPLLDGYRGRPKADVAALTDAIVAFSSMAAALGMRLLEAEINPLFVLSEGRGVRAADGVAVLAP